MAAQAVTARTIYSIARDDVLPGSRFLRRVDRRRAPIGAIVTTAVVACLGLLLGLHSAAVGSLIAFGTAGIYVAFLLVALAALIARVRGTWMPRGTCGSAGPASSSTPSRWPGSAFETVNIAWPRASLAPPGAPAYQVWAAPIVLAVIGAAGAAYLLLARPQRKLPGALSSASRSPVRQSSRAECGRRTRRCGARTRAGVPRCRRCARPPGPPRSASERARRRRRTCAPAPRRLAALAVDEEHRRGGDLRHEALRSAGGRSFEKTAVPAVAMPLPMTSCQRRARVRRRCRGRSGRSRPRTRSPSGRSTRPRPRSSSRRRPRGRCRRSVPDRRRDVPGGTGRPAWTSRSPSHPKRFGSPRSPPSPRRSKSSTP